MKIYRLKNILIRPYLTGLINEHKPTVELNNDDNNNNNNNNNNSYNNNNNTPRPGNTGLMSRGG